MSPEIYKRFANAFWEKIGGHEWTNEQRKSIEVIAQDAEDYLSGVRPKESPAFNLLRFEADSLGLNVETYAQGLSAKKQQYLGYMRVFRAGINMISQSEDVDSLDVGQIDDLINQYMEGLIEQFGQWS